MILGIAKSVSPPLQYKNKIKINLGKHTEENTQNRFAQNKEKGGLHCTNYFEF